MDGGVWWVWRSPWGRKELDTTEQLHFHWYICCPEVTREIIHWLLLLFLLSVR